MFTNTIRSIDTNKLVWILMMKFQKSFNEGYQVNY